MPIPFPIETDRLSVRPFEPSADSDAMADVYCDPEVMRSVPTGVLADVEAMRSALERYAREQERRGFGSWAVVERETERVIGDVGFGMRGNEALHGGAA
jgi:RimJ/RimL family protein N-acetyltransferase